LLHRVIQFVAQSGAPKMSALTKDLRAFHRERSPIKRDEIAARELHAPQGYRRLHEKRLRFVRREAVVRVDGVRK
jgi:hypothetical protein